MHVTLKDGKQIEVADGASLADVAAKIGERLAKAAIGAKVDGKLVDLSHKLERPATVEIVTGDSPEAPEIYRHTMTHILAQAVKRLYPGTKLAFGPIVEAPIPGFYYDMDIPEKVSEADLDKIAAEMQKIIDADYPVSRSVLPKAEALAKLEQAGEKFKVEWAQELGDEPISFYTQGEFTDLCEGPHLPRTGAVKNFKLLSIAGAYWRADAKNAQLQRIYGTAFNKKADLDGLLKMMEEAKRRDHRKLGRELELFSFHDEAPGFPFFHPQGTILYQTLQDWVRKVERQRGYEEIRTPQILSDQLWHRSGHWDHYKENMYFVDIDEANFAVKPMNCPAGCLVFKTHPHSYKDLPLRLADFGTLHRHELSGVMHGLFRVRSFQQDDAHIFCTVDQIQDEVAGTIDMITSMYHELGFTDYRIELSTRPEKSSGTDEMWEKATSGLENALKSKGMAYKVNPGDGAFYGPKIDFHIKDCIGRTWQCGTIQLDFSMPERFELEYIGADNKPHRPVMVHRAALGSFERFLGILIEQTEGKFPLWLAPTQVEVCTITDRQNDYATKVAKELKDAGVRVHADLRSEKVNFKIREAQVKKIPLMLVLGEKEEAAGTISVRLRNGKQKFGLSMEDFFEKVYRANLTRPDPDVE